MTDAAEQTAVRSQRIYDLETDGRAALKLAREGKPLSFRSPIDRAYYDWNRNRYWIINEYNDWMAVNETQMRRLMRGCGIRAKPREDESASECDAILNEIMMHRPVDYAGSVAWRKRASTWTGQSACSSPAKRS